MNVVKFIDLKMGDFVRTRTGETAKVISSPSKSQIRGKMRVELLLTTGAYTGKAFGADKCPDADVTLVS